jgi:hypothetical protein
MPTMITKKKTVKGDSNNVVFTLFDCGFSSAYSYFIIK